MRSISRETGIGVVVTAAALVAMVFDHLLGDDPGLDDPIAFVVSAALTVGCALILFGVLVPRTKRRADQAATRAGLLAALSFFSISLIWLGVTFPIAGAALALGLLGRDGDRRWLAYAAIAISSAVLVVALVFSDWSAT